MLKEENWKNILIVDDDPDIIEFLLDCFRDNNQRCTGVHTIRKAQKELLSHDFDLVFLDYKLPDGNGYDLYIEIRETRKDMPIIFYTSFATYLQNVFPSTIKDHKVSFLNKLASLQEIENKVHEYLIPENK